MARPDRDGAGRQHDGAQLLAHRVARRPRARRPCGGGTRCAGWRSGRGGCPRWSRGPRAAGTFRNSSTCETSDRLVSKISGTTSVAPAACSASRRESSSVRTSTGTSPRSRRTARTILSAVSGPSNETTTTLACSRPSARSTSGSDASPYDHGIARLARVAHPERVEVERDVLEAALLEHAGEVLADAAEAADDHVLALRELARGRRLERHLGRLCTAGAAGRSRRCACCSAPAAGRAAC